MNRISSFLPHDNMQFHLRNREFRMNEMSNKLGSQTRLKKLRDDPLAAGRAVKPDAPLDVDDAFARRVVLAAVERAEASVAADHRLAALRAAHALIGLELLDSGDVAVAV